jgi:hypothetical protein
VQLTFATRSYSNTQLALPSTQLSHLINGPYFVLGRDYRQREFHWRKQWRWRLVLEYMKRI